MTRGGPETRRRGWRDGEDVSLAASHGTRVVDGIASARDARRDTRTSCAYRHDTMFIIKRLGWSARSRVQFPAAAAAFFSAAFFAFFSAISFSFCNFLSAFFDSGCPSAPAAAAASPSPPFPTSAGPGAPVATRVSDPLERDDGARRGLRRSPPSSPNMLATREAPC